MSLTLRCTAGPLEGELVTIEEELILGRESPDPGRLGGDPRLSRRHARVFFDDRGRVMVEDLGSTNGTWVNGERLSEPRELESSDELKIGQTTFEVQTIALAPTVADAPPAAPHLLVTDGAVPGEEIPLENELLIGRSYGEPGALGGDRLLSRRHARISRGPGGVFFLEDTGSKNGTSLNSARVRGAQAIKAGDEIKVGATTLQALGVPGAELEPELTPQEPSPAAAGERPAPDPAVAAMPFDPQGQAAARFSSRAVIAVFASVFALAAIGAAVVVLLAAPLGSRACPQGFICHKPPTGPPLHALTTFSGSLGWRAEYDPQLVTAATADAGANSLVLHESDAQDKNWGANSGSDLVGVWVRAFPAAQMTTQAAIQKMTGDLESDLLGASKAPNSDLMFDRPLLGFHAAQGEVLEGNARTPQGPGGLVKIAMLSASSGGVTIVAGVVYPVQQGQNQQTNPDRIFDYFGDQILETIRFPSDRAV